jgi:two-component system, response regulator, stage 0 sporulation protein F
MSDKTKILYVDDEQINLQLFEINLSRKYKVFIALDGMDGLKVLQENPDISFVISDMKMPKMNGVEFVKKAIVSFPQIKFYILTGYEITNDIQEALNEGIILKYFQKPYSLKEIELEIDTVLGRKV